MGFLTKTSKTLKKRIRQPMSPSPTMLGGAEFGTPSLEDMLRNQAPGFLNKRIKRISSKAPGRAFLPDTSVNPPGNFLRGAGFPEIMPERRMPSRRPSSRFFGGGLGSILERLPQNMERMFIDERRNFDELGMEDELPSLPRAPLPMPQDMPRERFPMMRPGFAEGEEVNMNMRIADLGASQGISPPEQRMMLLQKTAGDMGRTISDRDAQLFGMGEISFEEAMSRARPNMDMDMVRAERNEMQQQQLGFAKGGEAFPDLTGDGQVTQADILKGRGVFAEGDEVSRETNEIEAAMADVEGVQPETQVIQQVMTMVMELVQSGASEEEIVAALRQMGLDDEDIQAVFQMLEEQMQSQQDPIQAELSQMS